MSADCHPLCALGEADHPGSREYRCLDADGKALPFPDEKPRWTDLLGIDPDYCGGMDVDEWLAEQRGDR